MPMVSFKFAILMFDFHATSEFSVLIFITINSWSLQLSPND